MFKFILVLTVILLNLQLTSASLPKSLVPVVLLPDTEYRCCDPFPSRRLPTVYCYHGAPKVLSNLWRTVSVVVDIEMHGKFELYWGRDEHEVWAEYESSQTSWGFNLLWWQPRTIAIDPFGTTCLGIRTSKNYTLKIQVTQVNIILLAMFTVSAVLFFLAPVLVHSPVFYHIVGITVGMSASVFILLYLVVGLLPLKRPAMLGVMAGGSTIVFYFFQSLLDSLGHLVPMYMNVLYGYLIVSGFISFGICYRFGPLVNPRSKNLIQWFLQVLSLSLVLYSSYIKAVTVFFIILIVFLYKSHTIGKWTTAIIRNVYKKGQNGTDLVPRESPGFEPAIEGLNRRSRFLTEEEYRELGRLQTEQGLEEIRQFFRHSRHKLKSIRRVDSKKLESFISGGSHLSREEMEDRLREDLNFKRRTRLN